MYCNYSSHYGIQSVQLSHYVIYRCIVDTSKHLSQSLDIHAINDNPHRIFTHTNVLLIL